ncbi:Arrestin domain containing [Seminavis robusta]|uniref:Arrestin domain containing n=1 Tax=Seminavis robusta TaxID=568900 RepID=A0A9N8D6V8_9STRA|nr:Arrestin domain containing [Seminavis robusta]|eukprot:Sro22_g015120.1 Arrestin domain containing (743) ;mRNA; f:14705-17242
MMRSLLGSQTGAPVKLKIYLNHRSAEAGTALKGKVVCEVTSKDIVQGESIDLSISGRELAALKDGKTAERKFCRMEKRLDEFRGRGLGPRRHYVFPFAIKLPASLPASCHFKMPSKEGVLQVEYKLIARGYSTKTEHVFKVTSAPLPDKRIVSVHHPITKAVKSLGRIEQGTISLAAQVKDSHIGRGDRIQLALSCRNDSLVDIQRVDVKVQEVVAGSAQRAKDGNFDESKTFKETLYTEKETNLKGLLHKATTNEQVRKSQSMSQADKAQQFAEIYTELAENKFLLEFLCPMKARDSYKGKLLHVKHFIKVKLMTNSVTDNPSIVIPLKIGNPPVPRQTTLASQSSRSVRCDLRRNRSASELMIPIALTSLDVLPPPMPIAPPETQVPERATTTAESRRAPLTRSRSNDESHSTFFAPLPPPMTTNIGSMTQSTPVLPPSAPLPAMTPQLTIDPPPSDPPPSAPRPSAPPQPMSSSLPSLPPAAIPATTVTSSMPTWPTYQQPEISPSAPFFEDVQATIVSAVPVPSNSEDAPVTVIDPSFIVLGGGAIVLGEGADYCNTSYNSIPPSQTPPALPSLSSLFCEMLLSVEDYDIIKAKLLDPAWRVLFSTISASEFGSIIAHVNVDFDQPRVAAILSPVVNGGQNLTCEYCAAAVKGTTEWNRPTMVERLAPSCVDLQQNYHLIRSELNEWDQIITARSLGLPQQQPGEHLLPQAPAGNVVQPSPPPRQATPQQDSQQSLWV